MKKKINMRLRILVLCLGCTLAGLLLQTVLFQGTSSRLIYDQAKEESHRFLENMQADILTFVKAAESSLISIYNEKNLLSDLKKRKSPQYMRETYHRAAYKLATENFSTTDSVVALYLYNTEHEIISTYRRAVTPRHNYPADIYHTDVENNAEKVREYVESDESRMMISSYYNTYREKNIVRFVLKVYNYLSIHEKAGYIVCDVDSKVFEKIVKKYRMDEDMFVWFQPLGDRAILTFGNCPEKTEEDYHRISGQIGNGMTQTESDSGGKEVFFCTEQEKYNIGAYALTSRAILSKNEKILTANLILITGIMLAVISISFLFVSRTLSRPLEEMTKTVKRIQNGETQLRMENLREDEVGELGESFNTMLDRIEDLIAREYKQQLLVNRAEYQALQAQINPHFLYNTLDTMSSIAEIQGSFQVSTLCQSLANLFRYSLNMKEPFSTVAQEILHLKNYIYVMNVRMQNQISYEFQIDDTVLQYMLPRISIQPLVENAVNHGLKNQKGEKWVRISAKQENDFLVVSVEDNGVGMTEDRIREIFSGESLQQDKNSSIGITNIHKRMQLLYGKEYGIIIESEPEKGTKVYFRIPGIKKEGDEPWK